MAAKQQDKLRNRRVELQIKKKLWRSSSNLSLDSQSVSEIHSKLNQIVDDYTERGIQILEMQRIILPSKQIKRAERIGGF